jgi:hypothetical protein
MEYSRTSWVILLNNMSPSFTTDNFGELYTLLPDIIGHNYA